MQKDIKKQRQPSDRKPKQPPIQGGSKQQNNPNMPEMPNTTLENQGEWQKEDTILKEELPVEYNDTKVSRADETGKVNTLKNGIW
jgi:hypothetical protein